jgi:hypothetical protein
MIVMNVYYKCTIALASFINYDRKRGTTIWSITF